MVIERAALGDLPDVVMLLERSGLLLDGAAEALPTMIVARDEGRLVGVVAIELYADGALLRSLAVDRALRGQGAGRALTHAAIRMAEDAQVANLFLLTNTAASFFPKFGFERIHRDEVPQSVQASVEFVSACCASAVVMRKPLDVTPLARRAECGPDRG